MPLGVNWLLPKLAAGVPAVKKKAWRLYIGQ
jgi:hypothetical protein